MKDINIKDIIFLALAVLLIVVGLKFTSIGSGINNIQNDGYNVTGGILSLAGGAILGAFFANKRK
jgi:glucose uptake protein GlcU